MEAGDVEAGFSNVCDRKNSLPCMYINFPSSKKLLYLTGS